MAQGESDVGQVLEVSPGGNPGRADCFGDFGGRHTGAGPGFLR
jgi:hypothetical protein